MMSLISWDDLRNLRLQALAYLNDEKIQTYYTDPAENSSKLSSHILRYASISIALQNRIVNSNQLKNSLDVVDKLIAIERETRENISEKNDQPSSEYNQVLVKIKDRREANERRKAKIKQLKSDIDKLTNDSKITKDNQKIESLSAEKRAEVLDELQEIRNTLDADKTSTPDDLFKIPEGEKPDTNSVDYHYRIVNAYKHLILAYKMPEDEDIKDAVLQAFMILNIVFDEYVKEYPPNRHNINSTKDKEINERINRNRNKELSPEEELIEKESLEKDVMEINRTYDKKLRQLKELKDKYKNDHGGTQPFLSVELFRKLKILLEEIRKRVYAEQALTKSKKILMELRNEHSKLSVQEVV